MAVLRSNHGRVENSANRYQRDSCIAKTDEQNYHQGSSSPTIKQTQPILRLSLFSLIAGRESERRTTPSKNCWQKHAVEKRIVPVLLKNRKGGTIKIGIVGVFY